MFIVESWRTLVGGWRPFVERPISSTEIAEIMHAVSIPALGFYFMLFLATAIATFGLISNSAPAIIGAMIIAPLMGPIISLSYGIVAIDWRMVARSAFSVASGVVVVVLFAFISAELIGLRVAGSEILSRTSPTLLDLGVAVAAGAAGAFAQTRKSILNSIAGVAIAVALVPPLAVTGIGLALGRQASAGVGLNLSEIGLRAGGEDIAAGAFLLFLTNLIGIIIFSGLVFICHRYGHWKRALVGLALLVGLTFLIMEPLNAALNRLYVRSAALRLVTTLAMHRPDLVPGTARIEAMNVRYEDGVFVVDMDIFQSKENVPKMQEAIDTFQDYLSAALDEEVVVTMDIVPIEIISLRSSTAPESEEGLDREILEEVD